MTVEDGLTPIDRDAVDVRYAITRRTGPEPHLIVIFGPDDQRLLTPEAAKKLRSLLHTLIEAPGD